MDIGMTTKGPQGLIWPNELVRMALSNEWVGFVFFAVLLLAAVAVAVGVWHSRHRPMTRALRERLDALQEVADQPTNHQAREHFARQWQRIDAAMRADGPGSEGLRHAWLEYAETIIEPGAMPVATSTRPDSYFLHLGDGTRVLAWWANIFVALGLTLTFLGIIAALSGAVEGLSTAGAGSMTAPLITLLVITSGKFWTSIGGVLGSIVLRWYDRRWHQQTLGLLERLCQRIERGTEYVPPQRLAALQLIELKEQRVALAEFSTQLAASIGDALGHQIQPVVDGLAGIRTTMDEFKNGTFGEVGRQMGEAIKDGAGAEMKTLAAALTRMTEGLGNVNDRLEGAGDEASEQIAAAAREFYVASQAMTQAFDGMRGDLGEVGRSIRDAMAEAEQRALARDKAGQSAIEQAQSNLVRSTDDAGKRMARAVETALARAMEQSSAAITGAMGDFQNTGTDIRNAFDALKNDIAQMGGLLGKVAEDAAGNNAAVLERAAKALEAVAVNAQRDLSDAMGKAITDSAKTSSAAMTEAFRKFNAMFDDATRDFIRSMETTSGQMGRLSETIAASAKATGDHAGHVVSAGREAQQAGLVLGRAANDVAAATAPIRSAIESVRDGIAATGQSITALNEHGQRQRDAMETVSARMKDTADAATQAWQGYHGRFAEVDTALAEAVTRLTAAASQHATAVNTQVARVDQGLADAVERLGSALDDIRDLANALEDLRGPRPLEAAE